jgi:hypothetical protein
MGVASGVALSDAGEQAAWGHRIGPRRRRICRHRETISSDDVPTYRNNGDGSFTDRVYESGLGAHTQYLGWGIQFVDVDNDGRKDIVMVNGHVYPEVERGPLNYKYRQPRLLYWNAGGGKFKDLSNSSGQGISEPRASRGLAVGDLANDGSVEVVINNLDSRKPAEEFRRQKELAHGGLRGDESSRTRLVPVCTCTLEIDGCRAKSRPEQVFFRRTIRECTSAWAMI